MQSGNTFRTVFFATPVKELLLPFASAPGLDRLKEEAAAGLQQINGKVHS